MKDINRVYLTGRLVADAEVKPVDQSVVASFRIANNYPKKNDDGTWGEGAYFFDANLWGNLATTLQTKLIKGAFVTIDGTLKWDSWKKDGKVNSKVYVVVEQIHVETKETSSSGANDDDDPF